MTAVQRTVRLPNGRRGQARRWMKSVPTAVAGAPSAGLLQVLPTTVEAPAWPEADAAGFDRGGIHQSSGEKFDWHGFDVDGRHRNGTRFDEGGNDVNLHSPARFVLGNPYFPTASGEAARSLPTDPPARRKA
ncbi:hypothetical protein [Frigoribacterium sp. UYMn621]|uniref:hypothetical protein n=1 Tax=Frigoribacterium sp. UYMn621 TaxID=3156343 RepID=UPI003392F8F0